MVNADLNLLNHGYLIESTSVSYLFARSYTEYNNIYNGEVFFVKGIRNNQYTMS